MSLIYEPRGRAFEYSPLACNLAVGCVHRCRYCFGPGSFRVAPENWGTPRFKENAVEKFEKDALKLQGDPRDILFSFASDPYMNAEAAGLMSKILPIADHNRLRVQVLTKNPGLALKTNATELKRNGWKLGVTMIMVSETLREQWEPGAPPIADRLQALKDAHAIGIPTWVSIEPVVDVDEALASIETVMPYADFLKVGKLNHMPEEKAIDWADFLARARALLGDHPHLIKDDLLKFDAERTDKPCE
jgi:DNA repair photolyase